MWLLQTFTLPKISSSNDVPFHTYHLTLNTFSRLLYVNSISYLTLVNVMLLVYSYLNDHAVNRSACDTEKLLSTKRRGRTTKLTWAYLNAKYIFLLASLRHSKPISQGK